MNGSGGLWYVLEYILIFSYLLGECYLEWVYDNGIWLDKVGDCLVCFVWFFFLLLVVIRGIVWMLGGGIFGFYF